MKRIFIFYSHFAPAYKAGGPVQSLQNMVALLKGDFHVDVVCGARDLGEKDVLKNVTPDKWNAFDKNVNVFYVFRVGAKGMIKAIRERSPDVIYVNGLFLPFYAWLPLVLAKLNDIPVIITPRGMLQRGAMAGGTFKKRLSIFLMKVFMLHKRLTWQATDAREHADIQEHFSRDASVSIVPNVPRAPLAIRKPIKKERGHLKLVFLSLIARKKNLDLIFRVLREIGQPVTIDVFGPVKDRDYWEECLSLMKGQIHEIQYKGPVNPNDVQNTFTQYHAFILLTKGENFGHAIYEALSAGTPGIISQFTPWGQLEDHSAGITVDIGNPTSCRLAIEEFLSMDQIAFDMLSDGAFKLASQYYHKYDFKQMYIDLFSQARGSSPRSSRSEAFNSITAV